MSAGDTGFLTPVSVAPLYGDQLVDMLGNTVSGVTGLDRELVRPRWQPTPPDQPEASVSWCAVGVFRILSDTNASRRWPKTFCGNETVYRSEEITVNLSFYGPDAEALPEILRSGLSVQQNRHQLKSQGVHHLRMDPAVSAPQLDNEHWVNRVDVRWYVGRRVSREYDVGLVRSANVILRADAGRYSPPK